MAVKNNPRHADIKCPMCKGPATVHACMIGRGAKRKALYIRCGLLSNGCGCLQPYGPTGQAWIRANMKNNAPAPAPAPKPEKTETKPEAAPAPADSGEWSPDQEETENKPKRRSLLSALLSED